MSFRFDGKPSQGVIVSSLADSGVYSDMAAGRFTLDVG
jgi:hypothetical protein